MSARSDVQSEKSQSYGPLDWVGMSQIQTAIQLVSDANEILVVPATLDVGVDLLANNRGIHMSRLYQLHLEHILNQKISASQMSLYAGKSLESHSEISRLFACKLRLSWPKKTLSLKSELAGFRNYPVEIIFEKNLQQEKIWVQFEVIYSSTCPQSASLSMEILKAQKTPFQHWAATPHAQRSRAVIQVQISDLNQNLVEDLIDQSELCLGTPVQTTVKKADEMRFAELNAENLMFCEDAARKIESKLKQLGHIVGFSIFCEHLESLHPHNAASLKFHNYTRPSVLGW